MDKQTLLIEGKAVAFSVKVDDFLTLDDKVLVVLADYDMRENDPKRGRNVVALNSEGKTVWRIEDSGFTGLDANNNDIPMGYAGVFWSKDEPPRLRASHPIGVEMDLDPETGKISNYEQTY